MLLSVPAFKAYTRFLWIVTLIGIKPPEATVEAHESPAGETVNDEIELLPALTALMYLLS